MNYKGNKMAEEHHKQNILFRKYVPVAIVKTQNSEQDVINKMLYSLCFVILFYICQFAAKIYSDLITFTKSARIRK